ncbi:hypothetical protein MTX78_13335 [Hymenobacter tibetensis]|uniref:Uncharacterized protein n=1 Tax=Hymenobacter tibetensis TaxID=497967 RepID=A0ABY4CSC8_9BACT|nr:hypothetical protein [Hymenobacter tibetensis]UOG73108.1 hypothetical protein MTX78_13335 [Hymenobacter tibetensis]
MSLVWFLLSGCQSDSPTTVLQVGYEDVHGTTAPDPDWLADTIAHTGQWSNQFLATADYGPSIIKTWSELGSPQHLRIGGWVWLPHGLMHAALVVVVERNGEAIHYRMLPIQEVVKRYKQWQLIHQTHFLPPNMQDTDQVKIYLWQWGYHYKFYFDDLFVEKIR